MVQLGADPGWNSARCFPTHQQVLGISLANATVAFGCGRRGRPDKPASVDVKKT